MNGGEDAHKELMAELDHRMRTDNIFGEVFAQITEPLITKPVDFNCLRYLVNVHNDSCGEFEDYSLQYVKYIVHTCETGTPEEISEIAGNLVHACQVTYALQ